VPLCVHLCYCTGDATVSVTDSSLVAKSPAPEPEDDELAALLANRRRKRFDYTPYLLLLPTSLFLLIFFIFPMIQSLVLAVQDSQGGFTLANLETMTKDVNFWDAFKNTLLLIIFIVPGQVVLALIMALIINTGIKGAGVFLYIWTIPLAISDLAAGIVWLAIFTERGYLNSVLQSMGIIKSPIPFLSFENPTGLFTAVIAAELWRATAIVMVILVAGLQVIPKTYSEAAEIFGASPWQRLWHVILPMLKPSLQVALILRTILAFQMFALVVALAGRTMPVLAGEAYNWYGSYRNVGVAASYALLILVLSIINTAIYLWLLRTKNEELA
jgi:multiple sugar transport system permease protein